MSVIERLTPVCCDANIVVRLLTDGNEGPLTELWKQWHDDRRRVIAPLLLRYEMVNAIHRIGIASKLTHDTLEGLLNIGPSLPVELLPNEEFHSHALEFARRFNRPATYDAHYLATAYSNGAEFWTGDQRLSNAVRHSLPWVHLFID